MAAKSKAPVKKRGRPKGAVNKKAKAKAKGLQLTTAQQLAFNKAYQATATRLRRQIAQRAAAQALRKYRLKAAYSLERQLRVARGNVQRAAVAAYATRMSYRQSRLAHQNSALALRVEQDMLRHYTLLGRAQYVRGGIAAYAHSAVMRTVDTAQANAIEAKFYRKLAKAGKKAAKSRKFKTFKKGPNSPAIAKAARAAGIAAARKVPKTAKAPPVKKTAGGGKGGSGKHTKAAKASRKQAAKASGTSKKHPVKSAKGRTCPAVPSAWMNHAPFLEAAKTVKPSNETMPWHGDEVTPNCVVTAVANHLMSVKLLAVCEDDLKRLAADCGEAPTIEEVLWHVWLTGWPDHTPARLVDYREVTDPAAMETGSLVIGFEVRTDDGWGDHAALALGGYQVVSWGAVRDRESLVEEAWQLEWRS